MKKPYELYMPFPNMKLARPYIINQIYYTMFPLSEGFDKGTIFPELYRPYYPKKGRDK